MPVKTWAMTRRLKAASFWTLISAVPTVGLNRYQSSAVHSAEPATTEPTWRNVCEPRVGAPPVREVVVWPAMATTSRQSPLWMVTERVIGSPVPNDACVLVLYPSAIFHSRAEIFPANDWPVGVDFACPHPVGIHQMLTRKRNFDGQHYSLSISGRIRHRFTMMVSEPSPYFLGIGKWLIQAHEGAGTAIAASQAFHD